MKNSSYFESSPMVRLVSSMLRWFTVYLGIFALLNSQGALARKSRRKVKNQDCQDELFTPCHRDVDFVELQRQLEKRVISSDSATDETSTRLISHLLTTAKNSPSFQQHLRYLQLSPLEIILQTSEVPTRKGDYDGVHHRAVAYVPRNDNDIRLSDSLYPDDIIFKKIEHELWHAHVAIRHAFKDCNPLTNILGIDEGDVISIGKLPPSILREPALFLSALHRGDKRLLDTLKPLLVKIDWLNNHSKKPSQSDLNKISTFKALFADYIPVRRFVVMDENTFKKLDQQYSFAQKIRGGHTVPFFMDETTIYIDTITKVKNTMYGSGYLVPDRHHVLAAIVRDTEAKTKRFSVMYGDIINTSDIPVHKHATEFDALTMEFGMTVYNTFYPELVALHNQAIKASDCVLEPTPGLKLEL